MGLGPWLGCLFFGVFGDGLTLFWDGIIAVFVPFPVGLFCCPPVDEILVGFKPLCEVGFFGDGVAWFGLAVFVNFPDGLFSWLLGFFGDKVTWLVPDAFVFGLFCCPFVGGFCVGVTPLCDVGQGRRLDFWLMGFLGDGLTLF